MPLFILRNILHNIIIHCYQTQARDCELHTLDLGNNSLTDEGGAAIARLLAGKKTLRDVNLYMNDIGNSGVTKV